ncbi:MAG TPA: hypothetical protein VKT99_05225 [Xanthobacteraceae bacterium]|jgi:hypothetical protein|nr:hypothetical protein [Xanthobacteraceae bacterium]
MSDQTAPGDRRTAHTYLFELKGIQRYVFDSGRLRDVVGASDLVAGLVKSPGSPSGADADLIGQIIDKVIAAAPPPQDVQLAFSRRASGAFCLHSDDKTTLDEIRALWRLAVQLRCPGLEMTESISEGSGKAAWEEAALASVEGAHRSVSGIRENGAATLPPAGGPVAQFVARTGRPATAVALYEDEGEPLDAMTAPQRAHADRLRGKLDGVASRFLSPDLRDAQPPYVFPRNIDRGVKEDEDNPLFPFRGDDTRLAVIHADISGLGETYRRASERAQVPDDMLNLSRAIERAVEGAAQAATRQILIPAAHPPNIGSSRLRPVPARPIVLGGDDITILVRADLALPFTAVAARA